jgi:hypothetical protein
MEWQRATSTKTKATTVSFAIKVMGTVFQDSEGCILVDFLQKGDTINISCYIWMLKEL